MQAIRAAAAARTPADEVRVLLQALAGFRTHEAVTINLRMIDLVNDRILVERPNTYRNIRRVPLQQPVRRHIEMMIADGLLTSGTELHCPNWTRKLNRIIHSAGIKPLPNGLRYGYAMHRLAQGISLWQLACELGYEPYLLPHAKWLMALPVVGRDSVGWFSA